MQCTEEGCKAFAVKDSTDKKCFMHSEDTEIVAKREEAQHRGGIRRKKKKQIQKTGDKFCTVEVVQKLLFESIAELRNAATNNIVSKCRAIGYLCSVALKAIEQSEFEERITELEKLVT